jgi:hypothetical protein
MTAYTLGADVDVDVEGSALAERSGESTEPDGPPTVPTAPPIEANI